MAEFLIKIYELTNVRKFQRSSIFYSVDTKNTQFSDIINKITDIELQYPTPYAYKKKTGGGLNLYHL